MYSDVYLYLNPNSQFCIHFHIGYKILRIKGIIIQSYKRNILTLFAGFFSFCTKAGGTESWNTKCKVIRNKEGRKENVLFNDALNTFYLRLYGVRHLVKDHSDSEKGNLLPPHKLLFPISSKGSFICTIPQIRKRNSGTDPEKPFSGEPQ